MILRSRRNKEEKEEKGEGKKVTEEAGEDLVLKKNILVWITKLPAY